MKSRAVHLPDFCSAERVWVRVCVRAPGGGRRGPCVSCVRGQGRTKRDLFAGHPHSGASSLQEMSCLLQRLHKCERMRARSELSSAGHPSLGRRPGPRFSTSAVCRRLPRRPLTHRTADTGRVSRGSHQLPRGFNAHERTGACAGSQKHSSSLSFSLFFLHPSSLSPRHSAVSLDTPLRHCCGFLAPAGQFGVTAPIVWAKERNWN